MFFTFKKKYLRGQSLVEAVLALIVLVIVISAIGAVVVSAINNSTFLKNQDLANKYAQQGMEYIRNLKTIDFSTFDSYSIGAGNYCLIYNASGVLSLPFAAGSGAACDSTVGSFSFRDEVKFTNPDSTQCSDPNGGIKHGTNVTVTVSWTDGKCSAGAYCHNAKLSSCFFDNLGTGTGNSP